MAGWVHPLGRAYTSRFGVYASSHYFRNSEVIRIDLLPPTPTAWGLMESGPTGKLKRFQRKQKAGRVIGVMGWTCLRCTEQDPLITRPSHGRVSETFHCSLTVQPECCCTPCAVCCMLSRRRPSIPNSLPSTKAPQLRNPQQLLQSKSLGRILKPESSGTPRPSAFPSFSPTANPNLFVGSIVMLVR